MRFRIGVLFALSLLMGLFLPVFSDSGVKELETRLPGSTGKERIEILVELTGIYLNRSPEKVLKYGQEALELLLSSPDPQQQMTVLNHISSAKVALGKFEAAEKYALQSQAIAQQIGDKTGEADALVSISQVYFNQGNYQQARKYCLDAQKFYEDAGDQKGAATTLRMLGTIYWRLGDFSRALDYALKSADIYEKIDDQKGVATLETLISRLYSTQGEYRKAMEYNFKAKQRYEEMGDSIGIGRALNNIGNDYRRSGNYEEALKYLKQSSDIFREMNYKQLYSYTLNNIGEVLAEGGDYKQAQKYFDNSLKIKEEVNDRMGIAYTLINIGKAYRNQGQYQRAVQVLRRALDIATEINIKNEIRNTYKELSETFEAIKEYLKALYYYKKFKEVNDSIFNETNSRRITELQANYEAEEKEKKIQLLEKDKEIQRLDLVKQRNLKNSLFVIIILVVMLAIVIYTRYRLKIKTTQTLRKEIEDRKKVEAELVKSEKLEAVGILAGGIAHDFNNLLTVIIGNLALMAEDILGNPQNALKSLKIVEKASLQATELSHKLITFSWGGGLVLQKTTLPAILESVIEHYPETKPFVQNSSILPDLNPIYGDQRQLRQVIYNLLKNAEEATTEPKEIRIRGENIFIDEDNNFSLEEGNYVKISIEDNGHGIPQDQLGKIFLPYFSTNDDVTRKGRGLGLAICYSITRKHNGQIYVISEPGKGTTVELYLPAYIENPADF